MDHMPVSAALAVHPTRARSSVFRRTMVIGFVVALLSTFGGLAAATTTWTQRGSVIPGGGAGYESGSAVAISDDGSVIAIGEVGANSLRGQVNVYEWSGTTWVQRGSSLNGAASGDAFGQSVALSADGTVLAVGASLADTGASNGGAVSTFQWTGSAWVQRGATISGTGSNDQLGFSVSLSDDGDYLAVGVPFDDGAGADNGEVQVYQWFAGSWSAFWSVTPIQGSTTGEQLGESVSLAGSGLRLVAGAPAAASGAGVVRAYNWGGSTWSDLGSAVTGGAAANDRFGSAVAMSGDGTAFIAGAPDADPAGSDSGRAQVYTFDSGSLDWMQRGSSITGVEAGDTFGNTVAISSNGEVVAVGAQLSDVPSSSAGSVTVYAFAAGVWAVSGSTLNGAASGSKLGSAVALTPDAAYLVAGANGEDSNGGDSGSAYVYASSTSSSSSASVTLATFTFVLPDGTECTAISPVRVQVGTIFTLPDSDAACRTMPGATVAGWTIPVSPDFTGFGSISEPFPTGLRVRVVDSQRFTVVPYEPVLTFHYDANVAADDACIGNDVVHSRGRVADVWVPRADVQQARFPARAACTPSGYELSGWNTRGDGSGTTYAPSASLPTSWADDGTNARTLFAVWRQK